MIIAGTGHRPSKLGGYGPEVTRKLIQIATDYLQEHKPAYVISGMALGWDTALAIAANNLDIPFIAAVPFRGQENAWPHGSKVLYKHLLLNAEHVEYVCDDGYAAWKMQQRNKWMVDNCDVLLALWDGSNGGTGNCIKYAKSVGRDIHNLWDKYELL